MRTGMGSSRSHQLLEEPPALLAGADSTGLDCTAAGNDPGYLLTPGYRIFQIFVNQVICDIGNRISSFLGLPKNNRYSTDYETVPPKFRYHESFFGKIRHEAADHSSVPGRALKDHRDDQLL